MRKSYWRLRGLYAYIWGTRIQERYWLKRHLREGNDWDNPQYSGEDNEWVRSYWDSRSHGHRSLIFKNISGFLPLDNILEIGCNCGPNLYLFAKEYPHIQIVGIDINPIAIQIGRELFAKEGISNVNLFIGKADELSEFQDKSFDIIFTDAVLMYIGPDKIKKVMREMLRISRRALILLEWHIESQDMDRRGLGVYYQGSWTRNYVNLLNNCCSPPKEIHLTKIPKQIWPNKNWENFGYIIEVILL